MENHDEQRIGSGFFCGNGMYAKPGMIVAATLTKAPVMIYAGQELGELGMDAEGFSGVDGRTTIFDYWGVKSLQAWANNGKFDGAGLSKDQKELREFYRKLINIAVNEKAVTDGLMYDLEYFNFENPKFNSHEQFAYFRKHNDELLLFALNFHDTHLDTEIRIPREAFQYMNIEEGLAYSWQNLLDENEKCDNVVLSSDKVFEIQLPAWTGKILKFKLNK